MVRDPHDDGSWGVCPVLALTGLQCPGCGGLRAVNDLAHLRLVDALSSNALGVLGVAAATVAWMLWMVAAARGAVGPPHRSGLDRLATPSAGIALVVLLLAFAVARNTAWGAVLAP